MPLDLAALLVEAGATSAEDLERALARQREAGGALDTALLELRLLSEGELVRFLERASGLPPPPAEHIEPDPRARRLFPARVAERHGLAPFRLEGRELSILATHPVDLGAVDEISFMLSLHLVPHVAPEWRVRELMARVYGAELPPRFAAVAEALGGGAAPPPAAPAPASASHGEGTGATASGAEADLDDLLISVDEGFSFEPLTGPAGGGEPAAAAEPPDDAAHLAGPPAEPSIPAPAAEPPPPSAPPPAGVGPEEHEEPLALALAQAVEANDGESLLQESGVLAPQRDAPPHWTREDAFAALEAAHSRDDVVAAALRYARDFFQAAALFAVTRDQVSGQDAVGWDGARARCRAVKVPRDAAGLFHAVIETSGPHLGPLAHEPGNDAVLTALGRAWPRIALVYPVGLRGRTVCILYADNGDAPVSPQRLGDLLLLAGGLGSAFERILREAKRIRAVAPPLGGTAQAAAPPPAAGAEPPPAAGSEEAGAGGEEASGGGERAAPGVAPPATGWEMREPARTEAPGPALTPGAAEPFLVAPAAGALPASGPFEPAEAVRQLGATRRGSPERARLVAQLVQHGPDAAAALRAAFPGPLDVAPAEAEALPVEERGPVLGAMAALGLVATPYLAALLLDQDAQRRRLAALLLGRARDAAAFLPVAERALDPDPGVRRAALEVLTGFRHEPDFRPVLERLRRALLGSEPERPAQAAAALARLGDADAVPLLIQALDAPEPLGDAAASALQIITCQRFGRDAGRWLGWWKEHRAQGRLDWLFAALGDEDREVRVAAAEALRQGGSPSVRWLADAPPAERSEAARAWRAWWDTRGQPL